MERVCGIYCISNCITNKKYIGKSKDVYKRWMEHFGYLRNNKHHSEHLQNSYNKYGFKAFIVGVIEECDFSVLDEREKYYIDLYDTYYSGYNCTIPNGKNAGHVFTDEDKAKHSIAIRKSRLKWKQSDWDRNNAALAKGRANSKLIDRRLGVLLYDAKTFEFVCRFNNVKECSEYLNSSEMITKKAIYELKGHSKLSYKGYILLTDNNEYKIDDYLKSRELYCDGVKLRKAIKSGMAVVNEFTRKYYESVRVKNNTESRLAAWKLNSLKSKDGLRSSGKLAVDIYKFDTGEHVGRWNLLSDFASEYVLNVKYLQRVVSGQIKYHKNFVVRKVN